jgi:hypothetical protein
VTLRTNRRLVLSEIGAGHGTSATWCHTERLSHGARSRTRVGGEGATRHRPSVQRINTGTACRRDARHSLFGCDNSLHSNSRNTLLSDHEAGHPDSARAARLDRPGWRE